MTKLTKAQEKIVRRIKMVDYVLDTTGFIPTFCEYDYWYKDLKTGDILLCKKV